MDCPPPIPAPIEGCSSECYEMHVLFPYNDALTLYQLDPTDPDHINCAEFKARVEDMRVKYEGCCGATS